MKRITKCRCCVNDTVIATVREYSFNIILGVVRVKVYTSSFPFMYEFFELFCPCHFVSELYHDFSDSELDSYFSRTNIVCSTPKVRSFSRPKYFGKNGRFLMAFYDI